MKEKIFWSDETKPELSGRKCKLIVGFVVTSNNEALLVVLHRRNPCFQSMPWNNFITVVYRELNRPHVLSFFPLILANSFDFRIQ